MPSYSLSIPPRERAPVLAADPGTVSVRLNAPTMLGRKHFDPRWSALSARHGSGAVLRPRGLALGAADQASDAPLPVTVVPRMGADRMLENIHD